MKNEMNMKNIHVKNGKLVKMSKITLFPDA